MSRLILCAVLSLFIPSFATADGFYLKNADGKETGPFELFDGTPVVIGTETATVSRVVTDAALITESFPLAPTFRDGYRMPPSDADALEMLKRFFGDYGISWPEGSWVRNETDLLLVHNTQENLDRIPAILDICETGWRQVAATVEFMSFDLADVASVSPADAGWSMLTLRAQKKGTLIAAPSVITQSGQEATVKGVVECIYPTLFRILFGSTNTNATASAEFPAVEPTAFETRETGAILTITPEVFPYRTDRSVTVIIRPEFVEPPEWRDYGASYTNAAGEVRHLTMQQPFFPKYSLETTVTVQHGQTVLIGGGVPMRDSNRLIYAFLTVHFVDLTGQPLPDRPQAPPVADDSAKE